MQSKEDFEKLFLVNTKVVCGGELDGLKKEYEGYTNYGLLDEIRKLKNDIHDKDNEIESLQEEKQWLYSKLNQISWIIKNG